MKANITEAFNRRPLLFILLLGFIVRAVAVWHSRGFLTLDDHFNFVFDADMIASGYSLPADYKDSPLYPYFGAFIMSIGRGLGNTSPNVEIMSIRLIQGLLSLSVIYFVYKILETKTGRSSAIVGGLISATLFIIPIMAVHQFEEALCQIPLLASIWILMKQESDNKNNPLTVVTAGMLMGVSLILRFPMISFIGIFIIGLLFQRVTRRYVAAFFIGILCIALTQAVINIVMNGEFGYSYRRNFGWIFANPDDMFHTSGYPAGPPWRYLLTLLALFVPPFSLLFLYSSIRGVKYFPVLGISTISFFIAHSIIANKQERFLLPIIPLLIILGAAGLPQVKEWFTGKQWYQHYRGFWIYFWVLNSLVLILTLFHYGKKDRIEPLVYIEEQHDATGIVIVQYSYQFLVPDYYLGKPLPPVVYFSERRKFHEEVRQVNDLNTPINYLVLYSDSIDADKARFERTLKKTLTLKKEVSPSLGDWIAHFFNPRYNRINTARVYSCRNESP